MDEHNSEDTLTDGTANNIEGIVIRKIEVKNAVIAWFAEINTDELSTEYEKQIEKEIIKRIACVGPLLNVSDLQKDYANDDTVYQQKVQVCAHLHLLYCNHNVYSANAGSSTEL